MRIRLLNGPWALTLLICVLAVPGVAAPFQLASVIDSSQPGPAGGSGDSSVPIITPDGRFVLFASTANNLVLKTNGRPIPALVLPRLNVFLRDRTNGTTTLVSVNMSGAGGGNFDSLPTDLSTNGRFALFESRASDLVPGDTNEVSDIFVRDLVAGTTFLASTNFSGGVGNGVSRGSVMTPDGRYVAFTSAATNLVAGDTNGIPDVFLCDLQSGTTRLVSAGATFSTATNASVPGGSSESPDITPDGRYVAFFSSATNLVPGANQVGDIYVRDMIGGTTTWASTNARSIFFGNQIDSSLNVVSYGHTISADGNFVAFETSTNPPAASPGRGIILRHNLSTGLSDQVTADANVPTVPYEETRSLAMTPDGRFIAFVAVTNGGAPGTTTCLYLWDGQSGTTSLASGNLSNEVPVNTTCDWPAVDPSGRYVAFLSSSTNMVTNAVAGDYHLYVRDMQSGVTRLVGADTNGVGSPMSPATLPALSGDGQIVAFEAPDSSLVPNDRNLDSDVFAQDLTAGPIDLVSAHEPALLSSSPNGPSMLSFSSISVDGRFVAFASEADNLVTGDTNRCRDVFVRDRVAGTNALVSAGLNGAAGNGISTEPAISGDGRYVAFTSRADNLVAGDANQAQDVFVRDLQTHKTTLVSVNTSGTSGNNASYSPVISLDGNFVLFRSKASDLGPGVSPIVKENLFLRNVQSGTTYGFTSNAVLVSGMSRDGRLVGFVPNTSDPSFTRLYVWDSQAASFVFTNSTISAGGGFTVLAFSPDRRWLAFSTNGQLRAVDLVARTGFAIAFGNLSASAGLRFSLDSRFLTYTLKTALFGGTNQVYLFDFLIRTNIMVSRDPVSQGAGSGNSDSASISADGRFIAYRSAATNIVAGDANGVADIYLYDRSTGTTTLLSGGRFGDVAADNRSLVPVFSGDGRTLFFESWASDLAVTDFNHSADVFAFPLLYASILRPLGAGLGPQIYWPAIPGITYKVQYKNVLNDPSWQDVSGTVSIVGDKGYLTDLAPGVGQRFYRVVGF